MIVLNDQWCCVTSDCLCPTPHPLKQKSYDDSWTRDNPQTYTHIDDYIGFKYTAMINFAEAKLISLKFEM